MEAGAVRRRLHPENVVTYILDGHIDYTNQTNDKGYETILQSVSQIATKGATSITLQGNPTPNHTIHWFTIPLPNHQTALPRPPSPQPLRNRNPRHRKPFRLNHIRHSRHPPRSRTRLPSRQRRRHSRQHRRMAHSPSRSPQNRNANHRIHDLRSWQNPRKSPESPRSATRFAGRNSRIHLLYPTNPSRKQHGRTHRRGIPENTGDLANVSRQHPPHAGKPRDTGPESPAGCPTLRCQRCRQHPARQRPQRSDRRAGLPGHS